MIEFRCHKCKNLLMKEEVTLGIVEIKCSHCNTFNVLSVDKINKGTFDNRKKRSNI